MWLRWCVALLCLLLVGQALAAVPRRKTITDEQKEIMRKGVEAGRKLTEALQTAPIKTAMAQADLYVSPWLDMVELVFEFVGSFFPDAEEQILEEVIRGFKQVNARLDLIIDELAEIKKLIEWKSMLVRFGDIEYRIRLMDDSLKNTLRAPNRTNAAKRYVEVFDKEYKCSGFALYDAVAKNDQVFSRNLLTAAIKYTDTHRKKTQQFSKGLFGLLLKATSIELAAEKFRKANEGMKALWQGRLAECRKAITTSDNKVEKDGWKEQPHVDATRIARAMKDNKNHGAFGKKLYDFLADKYYWRNWMVVAYDGISGHNRHSGSLNKYAMRSFRKWNRNFIVVSAPSPNPRWNQRIAKNFIHDYTCRKLPHQCHNGVARWIVNLSPKYGEARQVIQVRTKMHIYAKKGHTAVGRARLLRSSGGWYGTYNMVYFG